MRAALSVGFVLCWSSGFIGAKLGTGTASVNTLLMWRFVPLAVVLIGIEVAIGRLRISGRELVRQIVIGVLSQSGYLLSVYWAIGLGVSTGTTALIDGTQPLVAAALVGVILGQRVTRRQWSGLALGFVGVVMVTASDAGAHSGLAWWAYGIPFAGMLSLVASTFIERRSPTDVPARLALTIHSTASAILFSVLAAIAGTVTPPSSTSFWVSVGWLIVLSTLGGYGLYWILLRRTGVTGVNTLMFLMAPVTALWGAIMFGEPLSALSVAGLAIGLGAVLVVYRGKPAETTRSRSPEGSTRSACRPAASQ